MNRHIRREYLLRGEYCDIQPGKKFTKLSTKEYMTIDYIVYSGEKETLMVYFKKNKFDEYICHCKVESVAAGVKKGTHTLT